MTQRAPAFGSLFEPRPVQFGLRGDARLWDRLAAEHAGTAMPTHQSDVRRLIEESYARVVGAALADRPELSDAVYVAALSVGPGMSDGQVSPSFWRYTGVPMVMDRWAALTT